MERTYIAFISYRHKPLDMAVAKEIQRSIERYTVPKDLRREKRSARLGYVFRDQDELAVSSDLSTEIKDALDRSEYLIVICTPETPRSPWVNQEIDYFLKNHPIDKVLAVLADGSPQESFPEGITRVFNKEDNVFNHKEPLAANISAQSIRGTKQKLRTEMLRIFARLIGCSYDALRQRERIYKKIRIIRILATGAVLVLLFSGMLILKNREIGRQNETLEQQNELLTAREAELLANIAEMQLDNGDYYNAITNAVGSLSNKPYNPKGIQVLTDALDVYDVGNSVVTGILKQDNAIYDVVFSEDEKIVFTIDNVGKIIAFDIESGSQLWSVMLEHDRDSYNPYFCYICQNDSVLAVLGSEIHAFSAKDGTELWNYQLNDKVISNAVLSEITVYLQSVM